MKKIIFCIVFVILLINCYGCKGERQGGKLKNNSTQTEKINDNQIVEQKFQQLISYCKENQNKIATVSEEILEIVSNIGDKAITANNYEKVINIIQNPDYDLLMKTIQLDSPSGAEVEENKVFYFYCSLENGLYKLGVLYIREDKIDIEEYLESRYKSIDRIEKITDCIYVTLEETMQT